jgi:NTE family protein
MGIDVAAIASSSAGSIVGAFLAAGWSPERIYAKLLETDFTRFKDRRLLGLFLKGGLYAGDALEKWLDAELHGARFCDLSGDLFVIAADLIGREAFVFSRYSTPEITVGKAVRCSTAIPWLWQPQRLDGKLLADGQLISWLSTSLDMLQARSVGTSAMRTVILRLVSEPRQNLLCKRRLWPWDFVRILLDTMLTALENQRVPGALWADTILIRVGQIPPLQLRLTREAREYLFRCGYEQASRYFDKSAPCIAVTSLNTVR